MRFKSAIILFFICFFPGMMPGNCENDQEGLSWPPPPAAARISFVKEVNSARDTGLKQSLLTKLKKLITGQEKNSLNKPLAVAVDKQQTIYVADGGVPAVHIFNQKEKQYKKITSIGKEELVSPVGIAVAENGELFISDSVLKKVFCLDSRGKCKFIIGNENNLLRPTGLAVSQDKLYIVDTAKNNILVFDMKGNFISQFGSRGKGDGEFNYPTNIASDKQGKVYVVDALNFRIQVFDQNNKFLFVLGSAGDASGSFSRPKAAAVDSFGHIYVTDGMFDNMQIFSQNKEFLLSVGEAGNKQGEFWMPCGIAVDNENYIYVADAYNQRIQIFHYLGNGR